MIIGGGFGGIGAAIELQSHGITDLTILERAESLGGTWHHNTYPGAACDVPSHLYSFSFAQRKDWSRICSPREEIIAYLYEVAAEYGVDRIAETGVEVSEASWSDAEARWMISAADGRTWEADAVIIATGQLHRPALPRVDGVESFAGHAFHSAEWDHDYDLTGKRIAVIGTGASAVQFVPEIARTAGKLEVFQRTGNWFLPRRNRRYPWLVRQAIARIPGLQEWRRRFVFNYGESLTAMIRHPRTVGWIGRARSAAFMRWQLRDPELREKVWPDYTFGCKRVLFSSLWLPALQRPNVDLHTEPITGIEAAGVRTRDGRLHEVDCIIWGTGFRTTDFMLPMQVTGRDGLPLAEAWREGAQAHLGITVPRFPSMFLMYGPNTNTSGGSIIFYLEAQARYIRKALQRVRAAGGAAIEVRADVHRRADEELQARFAGTAWTECDSWYRNESGRVVTNWPGYMREYEAATAELDPSEYELIARAPVRTEAPSAA